MATIGQVGLGVLGQLFAGHLLKAGPLHVFDLDADRMADAAALGATPAVSAAALAAEADVVVFSLPNPAAVRAVMTGANGVLKGIKPGTVILDTSTIDPTTSREMYDHATAAGARYLDAPVSGGAPMGAGTDGARAATISFMVGGDRDAFEDAQPVMSLLGKRWFYLGPAGSGSTVKLISNLMAGLHNLVAAEAFVLGAAAGFSPETLFEVFDGTDAKSYHLTDYFAPRIRRHDFEPGFTVDLQYKDHRLAAELAQELKVPAIFNALAVQTYQQLRAQGLGGKDLVEAVNHFGRLADVDIYEPRS
jgi:3-hydroxyisobutyrate dehydrogenase-like beta-hydroxyacid dehydrogenase